MTLQAFAQPPLSLALGAGRDLPGQAARTRGEWLAPRPGRAPAFLLALLWGRGCANVVQALEGHLDALFADYACTPEGWPEAQAARQVLASLNMQLYRRRREGEPGVLELAAGVLLVHAGGVHFFQCGAVGLLRYRQGSLQRLGGSGQSLGSSAELALVQHNLTQVAGEPLLLAPQPLLEVADLRALGERCAGLAKERLEGVLQPLLHAPGAVALVLPGAFERAPAAPRHTGWPALGAAHPGDCVDGWTLQAACAFGPPGRLFRACDGQGGRGAAAACRGRCRRGVLATRMGPAALPRGKPAAGIVVVPVASSCLPIVRSAALADAQPAGLGACAPATGTAMRAGSPGAAYRCGSRLAAARRTGFVAGAAADPAGRGRASAIPPGGRGDPAGRGTPGAACGQRAAGAGVASRRCGRWPGRPVRPGGAVLLAAMRALAVRRLPGERRRMPLRAPGGAPGGSAGRLGRSSGWPCRSR